MPQIYGLLGRPLKHSLSPAMHTAAFKKLKINAAYLLFDTAEEDLAKAIHKIRVMEVGGFNVTVPYKEKVIAYLDGLDRLAESIGAVNTVLNKNGKLTGYNTDSPGFIASLDEDLKFNPKDKNILIIGAGGAGRAIGFALAGKQARSVVFYDTDKERAARVAGDIQKSFTQCSVSSVSSIIHHPSSIIHLIVNASNCGMHKSDSLPIDVKTLPGDIRLYDIIYNPSPTRLVRLAKKRGIRAVNGLGMLLNQGALSFELWTRRRAPREVMRQALLKHLNAGV